MSESPTDVGSDVGRSIGGNGVQLLALQLTWKHPGSEWWLAVGVAIVLVAGSWLVAATAGR
jgi:hypothetical protein